MCACVLVRQRQLKSEHFEWVCSAETITVILFPCFVAWSMREVESIWCYSLYCWKRQLGWVYQMSVLCLGCSFWLCFFVLWKWTWLVVLWQNWNSIENLFDICIVEVGRAKHKCWRCWLCGDRMEMVRNVWHYYLYCRSRPHQTLILTWPFVCWQNGNGEIYLTFFESWK